MLQSLVGETGIIVNVLHVSVLLVTFVLTFGFACIALYLLVFPKPTREWPWDGPYPFVTIQIPTYNERAALQCAARCLAFDYPAERFTLTIGDDSSDGSVSADIDAFAAQYPGRVRVMRRGTNGGFKPANLNHMLPSAEGKYLVVFDSDFLPDRDFLTRIVAPMERDETLAAVQARWVTRNFSQNFVSVLGGTIPLWTHHLGLPFLARAHCSGFIAGSAEAVRLETLRELGGWRAGSLTEDVEYSMRVMLHGRRIEYLPTLTCTCEAPFTLRDLCRQQMRWAYGTISSARLHWRAMLSGRTGTSEKLAFITIVAGHVVPMCFAVLLVLGALSTIAQPDHSRWSWFVAKTLLAIGVTWGSLITSATTLALARRPRAIPRMIASALTVGLLVVFAVALGITKAVLGQPINWGMVRKHGNAAPVPGVT